MMSRPLLAWPLLVAACVVQTPNGQVVFPLPVVTAPPPDANAPPPSNPPASAETRAAGQVAAGASTSMGTSVGQGSVEVQIAFFGVPLAGTQEVVFVLDRSGSMRGVSAGGSADDFGGGDRNTAALLALGGTVSSAVGHGPLPSKMDAAKAELMRTLRAMPDGTRFNVIFFDNRIAALASSLLVLNSQTRSQAEAFIRRITPGGGTAAVPALRAAYQAGARRLILLSDGLPNVGGDSDTLLKEARAQIAQGVRFDTVGLGLDQDAALLRTLASESGGMTVIK